VIPGIIAGGQKVAATPAIPWTPADLPAAPAVWCDWDSSVTDSSGAASDWENVGAFGGSFAQGTAGNRPQILTAELNGLRVLRFDGSNDTMALAAGTDLYRNTTGGWVFSVNKKRTTDGAGTERFLFRAYTPSGGTRMHLMHGSSGSAVNRLSLNARRLDADSTGAALDAPSAYVGQWVLAMGEQDWSTGVGRILVNGAQVVSGSLTSSGTTSNTAGTAPTLGASSAGAARPADVDVACLIAGNGLLTMPDRLRLEGWAAWACGMEASLPSAHQYRGAAPTVVDPPVALSSPTAVTTLSVPFVQGAAFSGGIAWVTSSGETTVLRKYDTADWSVLESATLDDLTPGFTATSLGDPTLHDGVLYIPCGVYESGGDAFVIEVDPETLEYITHHDLSAYCNTGLNSAVLRSGRWYLGESAANDMSVQPAIRVFDEAFAYEGIAWQSYAGTRVDCNGATILGNVMVVGGHTGSLFVFKLRGSKAELVDELRLSLGDAQGVSFDGGYLYVCHRSSGQKILRYDAALT